MSKEKKDLLQIALMGAFGVFGCTIGGMISSVVTIQAVKRLIKGGY